MRTDVVRCVSCNTIVPRPSGRTKHVVCESCIVKQRKAALAGTPRRHHIHICQKDPDPDDDLDDEDPLLGHWAC